MDDVYLYNIKSAVGMLMQRICDMHGVIGWIVETGSTAYMLHRLLQGSVPLISLNRLQPSDMYVLIRPTEGAS